MSNNITISRENRLLGSHYILMSLQFVDGIWRCGCRANIKITLKPNLSFPYTARVKSPFLSSSNQKKKLFSLIPHWEQTGLMRTSVLCTV